jgi:gluconokinase
VIVLVTGVLGAGKTTIGSLLAQQLGWEFADGDRFHAAANVAKMQRGGPLTDGDREPWLKAIRGAIQGWLSENQNVVVACSALKRAYREALLISPEVKLVYLRGSQDLIRRRVEARHGHFASEPLLASQFADLEEPKGAITVDVSESPEEIVEEIRRRLKT